MEGSCRAIITYYPANYLSGENDKNETPETDTMNTKSNFVTYSTVMFVNDYQISQFIHKGLGLYMDHGI